jgi:isochorismate synthase
MIDGASPHARQPLIGGARPVAGRDAWDYLPLAADARGALAWSSGDRTFLALDLEPAASGEPARFHGGAFAEKELLAGPWRGWPAAWSANARVLYWNLPEGGVACIGAPSADTPPPPLLTPPRLERADFIPTESPASWQRAAEAAITQIAAGLAHKIVLARSERASYPGAERHALAHLTQLRALYPTTTTFALTLGPGLGWFIGATPETLIAQRDGQLTTEALAGTSQRGPEGLDNPKDHAEHAWVVQGITEALTPLTHELQRVGPRSKEAGHLFHLQTVFHARPRAGVDLFEIARQIHPSPAVGGTPRAAALRAIAHLEPHDRGHYAGYLGWRGDRGDGHVVVALRAALLRGDAVHVFAGAGLVAASRPADEWRETAAKLEACKAALCGPL